MMNDMTVYGWVTDGSIICAKCADLDYWAPGLEHVLAEDARPLYSLSDDGEGMSCDDCDEYIFEPADEYCTHCGEWHWTLEDACDAYRAKHGADELVDSDGVPFS